MLHAMAVVTPVNTVAFQTAASSLKLLMSIKIFGNEIIKLYVYVKCSRIHMKILQSQRIFLDDVK
jgi:hypothetical protein